MKISELIKSLERYKTGQGDLEVYIYDPNNETYYDTRIENISFTQELDDYDSLFIVDEFIVIWL